jgi:hypothetical protein
MGFSSTWKKFLVLQWKNLLLKKRHPWQTAFEIIIPTLLFVGIVVIRLEGGDNITPTPMDPVVNSTEPYPYQFCKTLLDLTTNGTLSNRSLLYTNRPVWNESFSIPDSELVDDIMHLVESTVNDFLWPICEVVENAFFNFTGNPGSLCKIAIHF